MNYGCVVDKNDVKDSTLYVAVGFDPSTEEWVVLVDPDEGVVKQDAVDSGLSVDHTFVMKVKLPDISAVKPSAEQIRTVEYSEGVNKVQ